MKTTEQLEEQIKILKQAVRERTKTLERPRSDSALRLMRRRLRRAQRRRRGILIRTGKLVVAKKAATRPAARPAAQPAAPPKPKAP